MSTYRETGSFEGPFRTDNSVHWLLGFYLANGYRIVERHDQAGAKVVASDDQQPQAGVELAMAKLERGRPGAGWWTSNMSELHTVVVVERHAQAVRVTYAVETSGQWLNDVEKAFWRRELQWARRYATGDDDTPHDLRDEEARRAKHQTADIRSIGLWGAAAAFVVIVALFFTGII